MGILSRVQAGWNAFQGREPPNGIYSGFTYGSKRPDKIDLRFSTDQTLINSIYNRIAVDAAAAKFEHIRTDSNGVYQETIPGRLNDILSLEANIDQTSTAFMQDLVLSMLDEGCIAAVPVNMSISPLTSDTYTILSMRVGKITQWLQDYVQVEVYNETTGNFEPIFANKKYVGIIENPFYSIMNKPNSTLNRLKRRLSLMDIADESANSSKLDILIQLPYVLKSQAKADQAEARAAAIQQQLERGKYGVAYIDGTENVIQLNRPSENNLLSQIEYLTNSLFSQLGITAEVMNGTASEDIMVNYYARTIDPILDAIALEFKRKFLTRTAITQKQDIRYYRNPFTLTTTANIAEIADKFTRNEILSSNEMRGIVGYRPSSDPKADELRNSNISMPTETGSNDGV